MLFSVVFIVSDFGPFIPIVSVFTESESNLILSQFILSLIFIVVYGQRHYEDHKYDYGVIEEIVYRLTIKDKIKELRKIRNLFKSKEGIRSTLIAMNFSSRYIHLALLMYEVMAEMFGVMAKFNERLYDLEILTELIMRLRSKLLDYEDCISVVETSLGNSLYGDSMYGRGMEEEEPGTGDEEMVGHQSSHHDDDDGVRYRDDDGFGHTDDDGHDEEEKETHYEDPRKSSTPRGPATHIKVFTQDPHTGGLTDLIVDVKRKSLSPPEKRGYKRDSDTSEPEPDESPIIIDDDEDYPEYADDIDLESALYSV